MVDDHHVRIVSEKYPCRMMNQKHCSVLLQQCLKFSFYPDLYEEEFSKAMKGNVDPTLYKPLHQPRKEYVYTPDDATLSAMEKRKALNEQTKLVDGVLDDMFGKDGNV